MHIILVAVVPLQLCALLLPASAAPLPSRLAARLASARVARGAWRTTIQFLNCRYTSLGRTVPQPFLTQMVVSFSRTVPNQPFLSRKARATPQGAVSPLERSYSTCSHRGGYIHYGSHDHCNLVMKNSYDELRRFLCVPSGYKFGPIGNFNKFVFGTISSTRNG
jgi:hypothetical protein